MASSLPSPTTNRSQASEDLSTHGYCIWKDALSSPELAALRERLSEQAAGEDAAGKGFHDRQVNQRLWMLVNKGAAFRDLAMHSVATDFMSELLGEAFLLSSLTANIARPGGVRMYLHTDQLYVDFWTPRPVVANIAWMLDDFSDENGGTRLVPGSHLKPHRQYAQDETVAAAGPRGSALIFDGRLVHGTGENRSRGSHRHALLSYYCRPFMRQQENFYLGLDPAIRTDASPGFLRRLGFSIWGGLGRTDAPGEQGLMRPLTEPVGPLGRDGRAKGEPEMAL